MIEQQCVTCILSTTECHGPSIYRINLHKLLLSCNRIKPYANMYSNDHNGVSSTVHCAYDLWSHHDGVFPSRLRANSLVICHSDVASPHRFGVGLWSHPGDVFFLTRHCADDLLNHPGGVFLNHLYVEGLPNHPGGAFSSRRSMPDQSKHHDGVYPSDRCACLLLEPPLPVPVDSSPAAPPPSESPPSAHSSRPEERSFDPAFLLSPFPTRLALPTLSPFPLPRCPGLRAAVPALEA